MSKIKHEPQTEETVQGFLDTLTGFDEIAIAKHFDGLDPYTDGETKPIKTLRAVIFVDLRRKGKTDPEAKEAAMNLTLGAANGYFVEDTEVDETEPETDAGKDGTSAE